MKSRAILSALSLVFGLTLLNACSFLRALDFGGTDANFEFRAGWDHGIHQAAADTKPGQTDANGVYKPETPAAEALLSFPNIHAGVLVEATPKARLTPVVQIEVCSAKAPLIGWWELQAGAGAGTMEVYLGKRLLSVWEITVGPCYLYDFLEHKFGFGGLGTVIKF